MEILITKKCVDYEKAMIFMKDRVCNIQKNEADELLWFLEHQPVYTLGSTENEKINSINDVPVFKSSRGGKTTYHGPGQQVVYVLIDLKRRSQCDIKKYVYNLEMWIINSLSRFGIYGEQHPIHHGVWVYNQNNKLCKIAALGIKISKWVTYHGIAINLNNDLTPYNNIVPCGINYLGITSAKMLNIDINTSELHNVMLELFKERFPYDI